MPLVKLSGGSVLVDAEYLWLFDNITWFVSEGRVKGNPTDPYTQERLHHYIAGFPINGLEVDHIDGNSLNNLRNNLEIVSHRENVLRWASKTKGYYWDKTRSKWQVSLTINYRRVNGGRFDNEADAAKKAAQIRELIR